MSRSNYDIAQLHPLTNVPTKYQLPTPYSLGDMARTRFLRSRSLWQGQSQLKVKLWRGTTTLPSQCSHQIWTSYTLRFPRYGPDKIFKVKVTTARSKVKSRLNYDVAHLHPPTNVPTKYQHPTPYSYWDLARTRYLPPPARPAGRHGWKQYPKAF